MLPEGIASNRGVSREILEFLFTKELNYHHYCLLAANPRTPTHILETIIELYPVKNEISELYKNMFRYSPNLPVKIIEEANEIDVITEQSEAGTLSYNYEAEKFTVLESDRDSMTGAIIEGAKPVYRFFNTDTGSHLYTMNETERVFIDSNLDNYNFEGIKYYAFEAEPENLETVPVYRMFNEQSGSHLFTVDRFEVDNIQQNLPHFSLESNDGIAFYVFELS